MPLTRERINQKDRKW